MKAINDLMTETPNKHWLYNQANKSEYIPKKSISKYIRQQAKLLGIKVSVRTQHSIEVQIKQDQKVDQQIINQFKEWCELLNGKGFDGSIDYEYTKHHSINARGIVEYNGTSGTVSCGGYIEDTRNKPRPGFVPLKIYTYIFIRDDSSSTYLMS